MTDDASFYTTNNPIGEQPKKGKNTKKLSLQTDEDQIVKVIERVNKSKGMSMEEFLEAYK